MPVLLKCVKVGSKLRVRIISPNYYYNNHNCQFPRAIRIENTLYEVPASDVTLINVVGRNGCKSFYRIKCTNISIVDELPRYARNFKVFQDETEDECVICLSDRKQYVFGPCGHFYVCRSCVNRLELCPICRSKIEFKVDFQTLQN